MAITLERVSKIFANGRAGVRDLSLEIHDRELLVLVGPSGCGKSTVLRLIAGLETPTTGRILIDERDVTAVPPRDRDVAMVFQSYALYPHKTVADNLAFGLRMRGVDRRTIEDRVRGVAEALQIEALLGQRPAQLSGGQRQRVALGRAMVREPRAFLLDEPLSNLDPQLRFQTRAELGRLHRRLQATMVHVTHDQEEAMTLGDRVAVMRGGTVEQIAPPLEVYHRPVNVFVATFVGSPGMNLLAVTVTSDPGSGRRTLAGQGFSLNDTELPGGGLPSDGRPRDGAPPALLLGIRPRDVTLVQAEDGDASARIDLVEPLGHEAIIRARIDAGNGPEVTVVAGADATPSPADIVGLRFCRSRLHLFRADDGTRVSGGR